MDSEKVRLVALVLLVATGGISLATLYVLLPQQPLQFDDHNVACGRYNYSNATYVPFETLADREQELLEPALENGCTSLSPEEAEEIIHTYVKYQNATYRCTVGVTEEEVRSGHCDRQSSGSYQLSRSRIFLVRTPWIMCKYSCVLDPPTLSVISEFVLTGNLIGAYLYLLEVEEWVFSTHDWSAVNHNLLSARGREVIERDDR